jgi:FkbM family methyltransferase
MSTESKPINVQAIVTKKDLLALISSRLIHNFLKSHDCHDSLQSHMINLRNYIPLVYPFPLRTFLPRLKFKIKLQSMLLVSELGFRGCKKVGTSKNGNVYLKFNRSTWLAKRNIVIEIPEDQVIYRQVRITGSWEVSDCRFLAGFFSDRSGEGTRTTMSELSKRPIFRDFGANCGLISRQVFNLSEIKPKILFIEPKGNHVAAIRFNFKDLNEHVDFEICNFALGKENSNSTIYTERINAGNTSLMKSAVHGVAFQEEVISVKDTVEFCKEYLNFEDSYVIKSDMQGSDAQVLSRIPEAIWSNTLAAIVEVWALPEVNPDDVNSLLTLWSNFSKIYWNENLEEVVELKDVSNFWLSKSGIQKYLLLSN